MPVVRPVGRTARTAFLLGLLALAGLGACGGDDTPSSAGATVPKATTPTTAADPYAVPATIDAAYLNKVFVALEHVDGDATRLIIESRTFPPEAAKRLQAIYGDDEFKKQTNLWLDLITSGLKGFRNPPGVRLTKVDRVISARPECVYAAVLRDYSQLSATPSPAAIEYVVLRAAGPNSDPFTLNPTPWEIAAEGYNQDGSEPTDQCASPPS